ncbi:MAG: hypothetical protein QNK56_01655, partial [Pontimonas sp.]
KCSVSSATAASLFAMVLLLYDVMNVKGRGMKKAPALAHGAWRTESSYLYCHTPARAPRNYFLMLREQYFRSVLKPAVFGDLQLMP